MRNPKPNSKISTIIPKGLGGSLEMRGTVVMANASPKMMSERDSILSREIPTPEALFFSTKVRPSLVGSGHLRSCLPNENPNVFAVEALLPTRNETTGASSVRIEDHTTVIK